MKALGYGIGAMMYGLGYGFSRPDFASAEVEISSDGSVTIWNGASELGQGIRTSLCQIAAQELSVPYEQTQIISADTSSTPDAGPVSASRSIYVQGKAVIAACTDLIMQLTLVAANMLGVAETEIFFDRDTEPCGAFRQIGTPYPYVTVVHVAAEAHKRGRRFRGYGWINNTTSDVDPETSQGNAYAAYCWASQLIEVEVDTDTGKVHVLRIISANDAGKAINPQIVEGQVEGGAMQGMGFALLEDMVVKEGVFQNSKFSTYLIPTAADAPPVESLLVEVPDPTGPYGAKGIGEPATIPTTPAILNAIADATGLRVQCTPASPERLLGMMGKIEKPEKDKLPPFEKIPYPSP